MGSHINIVRESGEKRNILQYSSGRLSRPPVTPHHIITGADQHKKPNPIIYDWQLTDYEPERTSREPGGFYVSDWQLFSQDK